MQLIKRSVFFSHERLKDLQKPRFSSETTTNYYIYLRH